MTSYKNSLTCGGGMMDSILDKFTYSKYKGEHHFPFYSYLGPGSRLDIRTDGNYNPKPNELPINQLDQTALKHDIAYDKIKKEYIKDGNKQKALNAVHQADEEFIKEARNSDVQPLGKISAGIIKAKELAEKTGILNTKTFSGLGNKVSFTTKNGREVSFTKKHDPTERLKKLAGSGICQKKNDKKISGGFAPVLIPVLSAVAGSLAGKLFDIVKEKLSGKGVVVDSDLYKTDAQKRAFLKRVLY